MFEHLEIFFWPDYRCVMNSLWTRPADTIVIHFRFFGSLKVAVNLSSATERVSSRVREQLSQDRTLISCIYLREKCSFTMCTAS